MKGILSEIGRLNHIAIAVPNIQKASSIWENALGAKISSAQSLPEHGVKVVFIESPNTKVELLEPLNKQSPISKFLERNPNGGMHHMCYEVSNLENAIEKLIAAGVKILGDGIPKIGAHGNPVIFLNPGDFSGTLIELEEIKSN
jgi:methylmalonyl-CoA/ethylmalonyl-CoA epimerase